MPVSLGKYPMKWQPSSLGSTNVCSFPTDHADALHENTGLMTSELLPRLSTEYY